MRILFCVALSLFVDVGFSAESAVKSPVAADESLQQFRLSPELDLRIDLVAAEPEVVDPVAIAFDEHARIYVVEMRDYPNGPGEGQLPMSRVKLLEDLDGDGRYETSHLFADGLLFATGVLPWDEGVVVTVAGEVRFLKDTDDDNRADVNEIWFSGFSEGNPQLRANHPTFGPDGWIYVANGLRGGKVRAVKDGWPQQEIELRDHDFRFDSRTGVAEPVTGGSQFGLAFDAFGNRFICSNRNPCDHVVLEDRDLARNPHLATGKPVEVVAAAGNDSRVFPIVDAWTTSTLHAGQFTAACGVTIFTGDALPAECIGNAFTCEPTGSLVHREVLEPVGGTFRGTPGEMNAEFLASRDPWFRPVNLTVGPDGALYVVDMYRAVIEHPEWMPEELRTRRDLRWGDDRGRIYRVAAKDESPNRMPTLIDASDRLIEALDSSNGWMRETAARLLFTRNDPFDIPDVERSAVEGRTSAGRFRASQLLEDYGALTPELLASRLRRESDDRVIVGLLSEADPFVHDENVRQELLRLAASDDARIRFEVARLLGDAPAHRAAEQLVEALATIAARDASDRWTRIAVLSSAHEPLALYDAVVQQDADGSVPFLADLAELIGRRRKETELAGLLDRLSTTGPEGGWALPMLIGLGKGLGGRLEPALPIADDRVRQRLAVTFAWAAAVAGDPGATTAQRLDAVRIVALADRKFAIESLLDLASASNQDVRIEAVRALGRFRNDEQIAPTLLTGFHEQSPSIRSAILDALLADPKRAKDILAAIEAGVLSPPELGPTRIAALSKHPDAKVRAQAETIFAPPADREQVLVEYRKSLSLKAEPDRGRLVFEKNCAACHRIGKLGTQVGPDIADSRVRTREALLTDILDPNRAIDGRFMAFTVLLADGTVQTGLVASETANAVVLAQPEGKTLTIPRNEIVEMHSDGKSLMPVGIERTIPPQDMADLIAFVKNWRYLDGTVPLDQ